MPRRPEHFLFLILTACVFGAILANVSGGIVLYTIIVWLGSALICVIPDDEGRG